MSYKCERCNKEVLTKYGSGRFCSKSCAQKRDCSEELSKKFSEINKKNAEQLHERICSCLFCKKELRKRDIQKHKCKYMNKEPKICEICGDIHYGVFGLGRFCSRKCSNTRVIDEEMKHKISIKLKNKEPSNKGKTKFTFTEEVCVVCNNKFLRRNDSNKICCSLQCTMKSEEYKEKQSEITKQKYEVGKKVFGGTTKWLEYKDIKVQGSYELRMCYILDSMKESNEILEWEYTNDRIPYINEHGKNAMYLLDFKIYKNKEEFYYIETKGYQTDNDLLKWKAVRDRGLDLKVCFNDDIKMLEKQYIQ